MADDLERQPGRDRPLGDLRHQVACEDQQQLVDDEQDRQRRRQHAHPDQFAGRYFRRQGAVEGRGDGGGRSHRATA